MKKFERFYPLLLALFVLAVIGCFIYVIENHGGYYGSEVDWLGQHNAFAEYFRDYFYESGSLFPDFSFHLSGGVNMAQFIYYGLLRPEVLLSYAFPMIEMEVFLLVAAVCSLLAAVELFYYWLRKEGVSAGCAFTASLLVACAGPLMYHTHRHPMFINYLPWMILTMIGIRQYVEHKISRWMLVGIVFMIFSSYFFSVSALFICGVYAVYCVLNVYEKQGGKVIFSNLLRLLGHVLLGVGIAGILLVPTAFSMLSQHREVLQSPTVQELLFPDLDMSAIVYSSLSNTAYAVGMGAMAYLSVLYFCFHKKKSWRVLGILVFLICVIPLFCYLLNGLQYIRQKSLIPLIPLIGWMVGWMLEDMRQNVNWKFYLLLPFFFMPFFFLQDDMWKYFYLLDASAAFILLLLYAKTNAKFLPFLYLIIPVYMLKPVNENEDYLKKSQLAHYNSQEKQAMVQQILQQDASLYRFDDHDYALRTSNQVLDLRMYKTSVYSSNNNQDFVNFFYGTMGMAGVSTNNANLLCTMNPFFQGMMSVKYMLTRSRVPYNYEVIFEGSNGLKTIENKAVMPMAYASSDLLSTRDFEKLSYPYTLDTLYNRVIADTQTTASYKSKIAEADLSYEVVSNDGVAIQKEGSTYHVQVKKKEAALTLKLKAPIKKQLLILDLPIRNVKKEDSQFVKITINGIINKRSKTSDIYANNRNNFRYVLSQNKTWDEIKLVFSKGEYDINTPKAYLADGSLVSERASNVDAMSIDTQSDDVLSGTIDVSKDGYFVTSLPYQKGFQVKVDGKERDYEKVNTAFVGFPIEKGAHQIEISFEMPGKKAGILISTGSLLFAAALWGKRRYMQKNRKAGRFHGK